jgi:hypothetical protein
MKRRPGRWLAHAILALVFRVGGGGGAGGQVVWDARVALDLGYMDLCGRAWE